MHIAGSHTPRPWEPPLGIGGVAPIAPAPIAPAPIALFGAVKGMAPPAAEGLSAVPPVAVAAPENLQQTCTQSGDRGRERGTAACRRRLLAAHTQSMQLGCLALLSTGSRHCLGCRYLADQKDVCQELPLVHPGQSWQRGRGQAGGSP